MKKQLIKIFVSLLVALIATSLAGVFPARAADQTTDKYIDFMENVLSVDISKYTITLEVNSTLDSLPSNVNRTINNLRYELTSEQSRLDITFMVEKGVIESCGIYPLRGEVLTTKQYSSQLDAVKGFLERYQTYTKLDSNNLIAMLDNVDTTTDSTTTIENIKLTIKNAFFGVDQTIFSWQQIINGAEYSSLSLTFDKEGNFMTMGDARTVFVIGDTSVNVSAEKAIDIALENLQFYSYEMPDGSVVKDFKVSRDGVIATMGTFTGDYELRPYWKIEMLLDEVAPGNVFGITVFIWANTGEISSYSNMATGGISYPDNTNSIDSTATPEPNSNTSNTLIIGATIIAIIAIAAMGMLIVRKRRK